MIINASDLVLNPGKPPRAVQVPQEPDPLVIHYIGKQWSCDIEIPRGKLPTEGFASFLTHGCTVDRRAA